MTELVFTALYYGLWLALFLVIALLVSSIYFLLKFAWKRGWIKKAWQSIKSAARWLWPYMERFFCWVVKTLWRLICFLAKTLVRFFKWLPPRLTWVGGKLAKLPGIIGKMLKWVVKKIVIIIGILFMLSLFGVAFDMFLWALHLNAQTQYEGLLMVEFVKWGIMAIAGIISLAAVKPFFGLVKKLAS